MQSSASVLERMFEDSPAAMMEPTPPIVRHTAKSAPKGVLSSADAIAATEAQLADAGTAAEAALAGDSTQAIYPARTRLICVLHARAPIGSLPR